MKKRINVVRMSAERYRKAEGMLRDDIVSFEANGERIIRVWLSPVEALKARIELFWFNIGHSDKIKIRRGKLTKEF